MLQLIIKQFFYSTLHALVCRMTGFEFWTRILICFQDAHSQMPFDIRADQFFNQEVFIFYCIKFFVKNLAEHSQVVNVLENSWKRHANFVRRFGVFFFGYSEVKTVIRFVELYQNGADA